LWTVTFAAWRPAVAVALRRTVAVTALWTITVRPIAFTAWRAAITIPARWTVAVTAFWPVVEFAHRTPTFGGGTLVTRDLRVDLVIDIVGAAARALQVIGRALGARLLFSFRLGGALGGGDIIVIRLGQPAQAHTDRFRGAHAELLHLFRGHFAVLARLETFDAECAHVRTHQLNDRMPQCGRDAADLAFLALDHDHAQDALIARALDHLDEAGRAAPILAQIDAAPPFIERALGRPTLDGDAVLLRVTLAGVGEFLRERAVVGEDSEAFTVGVEATHSEQVTEIIRHKIEHGAAIVARMRLAGAEDIFGFIERQIHQALRIEAQAFAIHLDHIFFGVGLVAQFGELPVNAHTALFDQGFCAPARGDIRLRHQFLNANFHSGISFSKFESWAHYKGRPPRLLASVG
jgi:hypothetical protein